MTEKVGHHGLLFYWATGCQISIFMVK